MVAELLLGQGCVGLHVAVIPPVNIKQVAKPSSYTCFPLHSPELKACLQETLPAGPCMQPSPRCLALHRGVRFVLGR